MMRYVDFAAESKFHRERDCLLRDIARREWSLGDIAVTFTVFAPEAGRADVTWQTAKFRHCEGTTLVHGSGRNPPDGLYDWNGYPGHLTASQLHRVAQCLEVAEAWIAGVIMALPERAPENIEYVEPKRPDDYKPR